ncbi:hypothetical protein [Pedobacter zeae]|uniref:Uncharacterized protein n=1 Tax=Pedobacter zeae TaxID=1737356 RepID=A0A7W6P3K5_9SPHI|nr:hypothetical protein [Pedobacter zeae]MBB4106579.1 hypothetical protein [Pedobacter zeae]
MRVALAITPDTSVIALVKPKEVSNDFIIFYLVSLYWYDEFRKA